MITYAVEKLCDMKPELEALLPLHWQEIARDKDIIKLDPDWDSYFLLEQVGQFHAIVARAEGRMIGYLVSFVRPHLHYKQSLSAITDLYFVLPEYRKGRTGIQLFKEAEKSWKARGVQKAFIGTKITADKGSIFERLGWSETERLFTKIL